MIDFDKKYIQIKIYLSFDNNFYLKSKISTKITFDRFKDKFLVSAFHSTKQVKNWRYFQQVIIIFPLILT